MSKQALALRDRLLALRDEEDTASDNFARLDGVATRLESARLDWLETATLEQCLSPRAPRKRPAMRRALAARTREARDEIRRASQRSR
jgi:hypothetical protein